MSKELALTKTQEQLRQKMMARLARQSFLRFCLAICPWMVIEESTLLIIYYLERLAFGKISKLMIFLPPRTGKTLLSSLYQAWFMGVTGGNQKMMGISYAATLAKAIGGIVRDIVESPEYAEIFPEISLRESSRGKGEWAAYNTEKPRQQDGSFFAGGAGTGIAGRGWNLGAIDDPLSEQDADSQLVKDGLHEWWGQGFYSRRQPGASRVMIINTRWAQDDLSGRLLETEKNDRGEGLSRQGKKHLEDVKKKAAAKKIGGVQEGDDEPWTVVSIPAELDERTCLILNAFSKQAQEINQEQEDSRAKKEQRPPDNVVSISYSAGDSYAPRRWPLEELAKQKNEMTARAWSALYQQNPSIEEGTILKRKEWRKWPESSPPECIKIITCYDTAFEEGETNDFSARTTWGVFKPPDVPQYSLILIEAFKDRLTLPDLKEEVRSHARHYQPDIILIEKRASGASLIQELRRTGLPVKPWLPPASLLQGRGSKGKVPRAHLASILLEQGLVWYMPRRWADEVIDECTAFPFGKSDDYADTVTMALIYARMRYYLQTWSDGEDREEPDDEDSPSSQRATTRREMARRSSR